MIINTNVSAMNTHRQMGINQDQQQSAMEKLSSGLRINKAGDDAAGLAISEKMRSQINGLDQASRNAQDGISMIQTAEGALDESHSILQRMNELAVQSANDTNVDADREELQNEVNQLASELDRISDNTEFNTQNLLDGSMEGTFQIGANSGQNMEVSIGDMSAKELGVAGSGEGEATFELDSDTSDLDDIGDTALEDGDQTFSVEEIDNVTLDDDNVANYGLANEDGEIVATSQDGDSYNFLDGAYAKDDLSSASYEGGANPGDRTNVSFGESVTSGEVTVEVDTGASPDPTIGATATEASVDVEGLGSGDYTIKGSEGTAGDFTGNESYLEDLDLASGDTNNLVENIDQVALDDNGELAAVSFTDAGTNNVDNQVDNGFFNVEDIDLEAASDVSTGNYTNVIPDNAEPAFTSSSLKEDDTLSINADGGIDISSQENASDAISAIGSAIETVSSQRSELGAVQNRLDHTISNLDNASENLSAAESRIRDADMAAQMMEQTQASVKSQAAQSMLAQANQQPQSVLQLLG